MIPRLSAALATALAVPQLLHAAPPEVKTLFPAGGRRGTAVEVSVAGKLDKDTRVWSSRDGITAAVSEKGDAVTLTVPPEAPPGVCWLRFHNAEGATPLRPFVVGTLPEVSEKEPNDAPDAAQALDAPGVVVNGALTKAGEVDTFGVPLKAGDTLVASLDANRTLGSPMDGVLQLVSPRGFVLAQNDDDCGLDPQLVFTAEADGTYLVRAFAFPAAPNSSVQFAGGADYIYRLTLTTGPFADHATPMSVTRGAASSVKLVGWNLPGDFGDVPATESDDNAAVCDARLANTLTLATVSHPVAAESPRAADGAPQELVPPSTVTGGLEQPAEADVYRFQGAKGQAVALRCAARRLGSPLDPVLRLTGPDGKEIRTVDDSTSNVADPELALALPADGEYQVRVTDLHRRGGFRFFYCLTVEAQSPDFALQLAADNFVVPADKPLEIPVTVARTNGFDGGIDLTVTGLPEGVTAAPAKSEAKGDSSKSARLTLSSSDGTAAWSGPVRVAGTSAGGAEHVATAPLSGGRGAAQKIWITVLPKARP